MFLLVSSSIQPTPPTTPKVPTAAQWRQLVASVAKIGAVTVEDQTVASDPSFTLVVTSSATVPGEPRAPQCTVTFGAVTVDSRATQGLRVDCPDPTSTAGLLVHITRATAVRAAELYPDVLGAARPAGSAPDVYEVLSNADPSLLSPKNNVAPGVTWTDYDGAMRATADGTNAWCDVRVGATGDPTQVCAWQ